MTHFQHVTPLLNGDPVRNPPVGSIIRRSVVVLSFGSVKDI